MQSQRTDKQPPFSGARSHEASAEKSSSGTVQGLGGRAIEMGAAPTTSSLSVENPDVKQTIRRKVYKLAGIPESRFVRSYPPTYGGTTSHSTYDERQVELLSELINYHIKLDLGPVKLEFMDPPITIKASSIDDLQNQLKMNFKRQIYALPMVLAMYTKSIFPELNNIDFGYQHGYSHVYSDDDIVCIHETTNETITKDAVKIQYTKHGKPIIQQQNPRGCNYATVGMLIYEHILEAHVISMQLLRGGYLGTPDHCAKGLSDAGLCPLITSCQKDLRWLSARIQEKGSAIVGVNIPSGHVVVVDHITDTSVRLRDAYHAWEVDVKASAFEKSWDEKTDIVQVDRKVQDPTS